MVMFRRQRSADVVKQRAPVVVPLCVWCRPFPPVPAAAAKAVARCCKTCTRGVGAFAGLPISTTQTITGGLLAIGLFEGLKGVNWRAVRNGLYLLRPSVADAASTLGASEAQLSDQMCTSSDWRRSPSSSLAGCASIHIPTFRTSETGASAPHTVHQCECASRLLLLLLLLA